MTRTEALNTLSKWSINPKGPTDRGFVRAAVFSPQGFDVPIVKIESTTQDGHIAIETLINAITALVQNGLPKPRPKKIRRIGR